MASAWVIRPKPDGNNRLEEFLDKEIVAIGWPNYPSLDEMSKSDIREEIEERDGYEGRKLGQLTGQFNRFVNEISMDDLVLVPSGNNVYVGRIGSEYYHEEGMVEEGYPHQRDVSWVHEKEAIDRSTLPGKLHDTLKGRLTIFSADYELAADLLDNETHAVDEDPYAQLQENYLENLQNGELNGMIDRQFEDAAEIVLKRYYTPIRNVAGQNDPEGDTDILVEGPGDVTIRVQVKNYYGSSLGKRPVRQLEKSMEEGDTGIVLTGTNISEEAKESAANSDHQIGFIDGEEFTELLFEELDSFSSDELKRLGLGPPRLF